MTDAFTAAAGTDPSRLGKTIVAIIGAVALVVLAHTVQQLWNAHNDGLLKGGRATQYAARALILTCFLLGVLAW